MYTKRCRRCRLELRASDFYTNPVTPDGLSSHCRQCCRAHRNFSTGKLRLSRWAHQGILDCTPARARRLLIYQAFKCALCGRDFKQDSLPYCVDHNHGTGKLRGLLCRWCNVMLGRFENIGYVAPSKEVMTNYLKVPPAVAVPVEFGEESS